MPDPGFTSSNAVLFWQIMGAFFALVMGTLLIVFVNYLLSKKFKGAVCPYTGEPVRPCQHLEFSLREKAYEWFNQHEAYRNQRIDFRRAAYCRRTGRIFPDCIKFWGGIFLDWTFLRKRCPGTWVSWGSLSLAQKRAIQEAQGSLEGYQTEYSSQRPAPRMIEKEYIYLTPGPLYVDLATKVVMGWKVVPGTDLEVLIVQNPEGKTSV